MTALPAHDGRRLRLDLIGKPSDKRLTNAELASYLSSLLKVDQVRVCDGDALIDSQVDKAPKSALSGGNGLEELVAAFLVVKQCAPNAMDLEGFLLLNELRYRAIIEVPILALFEHLSMLVEFFPKMGDVYAETHQEVALKFEIGQVS